MKTENLNLPEEDWNTMIERHYNELVREVQRYPESEVMFRGMLSRQKKERGEK